MEDGGGDEKQGFSEFFSTVVLIDLIKVAVEKVGAIRDSATDERVTRLRAFTHASLSYFWQSPENVDGNCLYCIETYGDSFKTALHNFNADTADDMAMLELVALFCYKFVTELEIAHRYGLPSSLRGWTSSIKEAYFLDYTNKVDFQSVQQRLSVGVLRKYLHREELVTLAELPQLIRTGERFKDDLEKTLVERNGEVDSLKRKLDEYEKSFNFLGLNRAFRSVRSLKLKEAKNTLRFLVLLGVLMVAPLMIKMGVEFSSFGLVSAVKDQLAETLKPSAVAVAVAVAASEPKENIVSVPGNVDGAQKKPLEDEDKASKYLKQMLGLLTFIGYELVVLYFFKVALHNYRSVKSQLLQIDLRVALTQFILKYAEFAMSAKTAAVGTFERFEQVIFSGIVGGDSEIPATFDGLDQVVKVLEKVKLS